MSTLSNIIFNKKQHYITSPYGKRTVITTSSGKTSSIHSGTDYGTYGKKLAQYAIENGTVLSCGIASDGAKYVWVKYPRINKKFLHYHLDKISVTSGQSVKRGTLLGYTGKTGKATGIHLHLGVKDLTTGKYEDPEVFSSKYTSPAKYSTGLYVVTTSLLRIRSTASNLLPYRKFKSFTANAQYQIKKYNNGKAADGLVKGCECSVSKVSGNWGKIPSGWICLNYCRKKV